LRYSRTTTDPTRALGNSHHDLGNGEDI
jgi:hypothetical protein